MRHINHNWLVFILRVGRMLLLYFVHSEDVSMLSLIAQSC